MTKTVIENKVVHPNKENIVTDIKFSQTEVLRYYVNTYIEQFYTWKKR